MGNNFEDDILKSLKTIIKLLTISSMKEESQKKKILLLDNTGFSPREIADLLDTTPNTVSVALHNMKKKDSNSNQKMEASEVSKEEDK